MFDPAEYATTLVILRRVWSRWLWWAGPLTTRHGYAVRRLSAILGQDLRRPVVKSYTSRKTELKPFPFELDGVKFVAPGGINLLDLCDMARLADIDIREPAGLAVISDMFQAALLDDYPRFKAHVRRHVTEPEVLFNILTDMVQEVTGRPLDLSSPSSAGQTYTRGTSSIALSPEASARLAQAVTEERQPFPELTPERIAEWQRTATPTPTSPPGQE